MKISKTHNRKVEFLGVEEGHAIISESEGYEINGRMRWNKAVISLSPQELKAILTITEDNIRMVAKQQFEEATQ